MTSQMNLDDICRGVTEHVLIVWPMVSPSSLRTRGLIRAPMDLERGLAVWETRHPSDLQHLLIDDPAGGGITTEAYPNKSGIRRGPASLLWCRSVFNPRFVESSCQVISSCHCLTSHSPALYRLCHDIKTHSVSGSRALRASRNSTYGH
jgi:hypothetical protein